MNLRLDWRATANVTMLANYTWPHAIDTQSDTFSSSGNQVNLGWLDPFNPSLDKGDSYYDLRHRVTVSAIYTIPVKSQHAFAKYLLAGWSLVPNFQAYTGSPFSLDDCTNGYSVCPYAMFTGPVPSTPSGPLAATARPNEYVYLNVASTVDSSFYNPKIGVSDYGLFPGNMIRSNFFRGPGLWKMDFALHKNIPFGEMRRLLYANMATTTCRRSTTSRPYTRAAARFSWDSGSISKRQG